MRSQTKRLLALFLAVLMGLSIVGCGTTAPASSTTPTPSASETAAASETPSATPAPAKDPITISFFGRPGTVNFASGPQDDPVAKEITRVTGITVNWEGNPTEDKLQAVLASGQLPDVMMIRKQEMKQLIEGNNIIDLEPLLAADGPDILKNYPMNLDFSKQNFSNGTGKLYAIPSGQLTTDPSAGLPSWGGTGLYLRWDYYKELGFPKIANRDDIITVVKQMLDKHPTNEDGQTNFGLSMWFDWGMWTYSLMGDYSGVANQGAIEIPIDTLQAYPRYTTPDSQFWQEVEFYYKANQAGILDPETFTQSYDNALAKAYAKRTIACLVGWPYLYAPGANPVFAAAGEAKGWIQIPFEGQTKANIATAGSAPGDQTLFVISKSCKNPERAMDLINYLFSEEGIRTLHSGVKGVHWDVVDGKPIMLPEVMQQIKTDSTYQLAQGITKYSNYAGAWTDGRASDGSMLCLLNEPSVLATNNTPLDKEYIAHYDPTLSYPNEYFIKNLKYKFLDTAFAAMQTPFNDDQQLLNTQIESYLTTNCPTLVLNSKTDEEFQAGKQAIIDQLKTMGVEALEQWKLNDFNTIKAKLGK